MPQRVSPIVLQKQASSRKSVSSPNCNSDPELESFSNNSLSNTSSSDSEVEPEVIDRNKQTFWLTDFTMFQLVFNYNDFVLSCRKRTMKWHRLTLGKARQGNKKNPLLLNQAGK